MNPSFLKDLAERLELITKRTRGAFGFMTDDQINWRAKSGTWSIAQNLDHLILFNKSFFPMLVQAPNGHMPSRKREKVPVLPDFWANYYRKVLSGGVAFRKRKTAEIYQPSFRPYNETIIDQFVEHQGSLMQLIQDLEGVDLSMTITLPSKSIATMKLADCLAMLVQHEEHHLQQALAVKSNRTFPTGKTTNIAQEPLRGPKIAHTKSA